MMDQGGRRSGVKRCQFCRFTQRSTSATRNTSKLKRAHQTAWRAGHKHATDDFPRTVEDSAVVEVCSLANLLNASTTSLGKWLRHLDVLRNPQRYAVGSKDILRPFYQYCIGTRALLAFDVRALQQGSISNESHGYRKRTRAYCRLSRSTWYLNHKMQSWYTTTILSEWYLNSRVN